MALNWAMLDEGRDPVPLPFEMIIKAMEDAELSLVIPEAPPSGSATSGGSGGTKKLKSTGRIWLTDQRVEWYIYRLVACCWIFANLMSSVTTVHLRF